MIKVLAIDDSKMMSLCLRRCLESAGYEGVEWMPLSAMEIPEYITTSAPGLIISGYQMLGCNGVTVARTKQKANPKIPLLVLTSFHGEEMTSNLLRFGVKQILTKPIEAGALIQAVKDALEYDTQIWRVLSHHVEEVRAKLDFPSFELWTHRKVE